LLSVRDGKKRTVSKKFLPGYILIQMDLPDLVWKAVVKDQEVTGVKGFVGTPADKKPSPHSPQGSSDDMAHGW
jgi:transcriptional antiterminator NusG